MNGITQCELKVILAHLRDYDVVKLDRELPHLKQKCDVMSNRLMLLDSETNKHGKNRMLISEIGNTRTHSDSF